MEYIFSEKTILLEKIEELDSSFKIKSYKQKITLLEKSKIPLKPISELLDDLFLKNKTISLKTKKSISQIIYSPKDRIIVIITNYGKEFIWNRDKLLRNYGWFFYIASSKEELSKKKEVDKKKKDKKDKKVKKEEITVREDTYQCEINDVPLTQKEHMRSLYNTKEYFQYLKLMNSEQITQMPIKDVLDDFFLKNDNIPLKEKKAIKKINYYDKERVIVIKSLIGDKMYENLENLVKRYGWYFYITGVPVGTSDISVAIDKIEKRYTSDYFNNIRLTEDIDSKDLKITLYPIVLKPNHNCIILGIGNFNLLLDCGITEEYFEYINNYIRDYDSILRKAEHTEELINKFEDNTTYIKDLDLLKDFENHNENHLEKNSQFEEKKDQIENNNEGKLENVITPSKTESKVKIDTIFISHSHFDHVSGLKELIKSYPDIPILCSRITLDLFLLRDSNFLKQKSHEEIEEEEYRNIIKNVIYVENGEKIEFKDKDCFISFFHAGHMPGALMLLVKIKDFRFLYTGDYTYWDITPFAGTRRFLEQISRPIDFLLIDASCANEDFGDPSQQFHSLILFMEQKAEYGDNSLIGADPSSLAISFLLILWRYFRKLQLRKDYKNRPNIYVDQMVRKNIQVINHRYEYIYGPISRLIRDKANPFNSIKIRWFDLDNLEFLRGKNNIIISHPPDLSYGIIRNIINVIGRNPHNLVFLSGAIHEPPGLPLIEGANELEFTETWKVPFRSLLINKFAPDLKIKLHGDKQQLTEMIKNLEPKKVCFFHQSHKRLFEVAEYVQSLGVEKVSIPTKRKLMILK